ncbi:hypothetical protein BDN72DRAFT_898507 [Pluteus cervinus]|uniref:Uncharacterized protein n=1 Tax=Pluteus cervinus TaxID=181527 RepID=A0ACD3APY1_9AGAR|nr:hypothetical protein BDN72DRAFT_898507 [Pluteus cervinus]
MADDQRDALAEYFKISSRRPWNNWFLGPALSLPPQYREFKLKGELCIEYHQYGDPLNPTKNHVPFRLPFRATETIHLDNAGTTQAQAVRVSMDDPDDDEALKAIDNDRLEHFYVKGQYHPGVLCVKLLKYEGNSNSAFKTSTFRKLDFATLGKHHSIRGTYL